MVTIRDRTMEDFTAGHVSTAEATELLAEAVEAVRDGLADGMAAVAASGRSIVARQIVTSMRHLTAKHEVAELAVDYRHDSVCGFDIAGAEAGFPPSLHAESFSYLRHEMVPFTIHAGEAFGVSSIRDAVASCGATRIGHGVRIVEDITTDGDGGVRLGPVAAYVRDRRIPLEICPTSNVQTGVCASVAEHPFGQLAKLRFRVTVSCDNRLMSRTTLSRELALLADAFGYRLADLRWFTLNAAKSAFYGYDERRALVEDVIKRGFAAAASS